MLYRRSCAIDGALMAWDCRNLRGERAARTLAQISRNLCGVMWLSSVQWGGYGQIFVQGS